MSTETAVDAPAARYTVRATRTAVHIDGLAPQTTGGGIDTGKGYVSYTAYSHCPALTRSATRMQVCTFGIRNAETEQVERVREFASVQAVYDTALGYARRNGGERVCAHCTTAAAAAGATV